MIVASFCTPIGIRVESMVITIELVHKAIAVRIIIPKIKFFLQEAIDKACLN
ncbi:MAG: hypothetical protein ACJA0I_000773 [Gammaproteobacteria bacterium]|jgi:hypothetical protein